jgi:hypothetical protein
MSLGNPDDLTPAAGAASNNPAENAMATALLKKGDVTAAVFSAAPSSNPTSTTPAAPNGTPDSAPAGVPIVSLSELQSHSVDSAKIAKGAVITPESKLNKQFNLVSALAYAVVSVACLIVFIIAVFFIGLTTAPEWGVATVLLAIAVGCLVKFIQELRRPRV